MFLFSDARSCFEGGKIMVQTEFPFYEPGNLIKGKIYIHIDRAMFCNFIEIRVKGVEKAAHTRFYQEQVDQGNGQGTQSVERSERVKMRRVFLEYKQPIFNMNGMLNPGSYEVDFSCTLPVGLASSLHFFDTSRRERPKAKVRYFIKATLHSNNSASNMKYKQILMVREPAVPFRVGEQ